MLLEALKPHALRYVVSFFMKHAKFSPSGIDVTLEGMLSFFPLAANYVLFVINNNTDNLY